jgi:sugar phosphate isomerase/epimerase
MPTTTRRTFAAQAAALLPLLSSRLGAADPLLPRLGVQLYTVRDVIMKDPVVTLKAIESIGYTEVEVVFASLDAIWPALHQTSLKAVSAHVDGSIFLNPDKSQLDHALSNLKNKGFDYAVFPYLANNLRGNADTYKRMADDFNEIGQRVKGFGLQFCYHNHAFEFATTGDTTPLKLLLATDPELVGWEMDIFWVSVAGHDPVQLLQEHGDRIPLLHLKDKAKGTPVQYNENVPHSTFKEVGSGVIDIPAVLKAASQAGVKHYFVEQDYTPGDPLASLRKSYEYLHEFMGK